MAGVQATAVDSLAVLAAATVPLPSFFPSFPRTILLSPLPLMRRVPTATSNLFQHKGNAERRSRRRFRQLQICSWDGKVARGEKEGVLH